ncbi:hypothetical protein [Halomonas phage vB_HmeY_H4907]|jgi:hypothetical protein|nr:hypothetical protein [Halomonas phage vB_HmeY_H4907]
MYKYAVSDLKGEITQVLSGSPLYIRVPNDSDVLDTTHYVDVETETVLPKRPIEVVVEQGADPLSITLTGVPSGVTLSTNGMETKTDDQPLVIEYDVPGTYTISFSGHVRYLDHELEVTVGDA